MKKYGRSDVLSLSLGDVVAWKLRDVSEAHRIRNMLCHYKHATGLQYKSHWNESLKELTIRVLMYEEF